MRDTLGRFLKGSIPPYVGRELPPEVKAKLREKALTPERIQISMANLQPNGVNVAKRADVREKIAQANRGRIPSLDTRQRKSEIEKKRFENPELRQQISTALKNYCKDPNVRQRKAEASMGRPQSVTERAKKAEATKRSWQEPEIRNRILSGIKEANDKPEVKDRRRAGIHRRWQSPNERQRQSLLSKQLWQDPGYVKKVLDGIGRSPTKPERILTSILDEYFPEFKYNGDYSLGIMVAGQIPDFVNVNGKKEIIEVFGDYHHSPELVAGKWHRTELGKVMLYNSVGWKCLILWEHEIKELAEDQLIHKIGTFLRKGRQNARTS